MIITWPEDSTAYEAIEKIALKKYRHISDSLIVQFRMKYDYEERWDDYTELLLIEGDWGAEEYVWQDDWWEGEQCVDLIAIAPVCRIRLPEEFAVNEDLC